MARAEELNFNALIKPVIVEGIQGDDIKVDNESNRDIRVDSKLDISKNNISDIKIDSKIDNESDIILTNQKASDLSKKKTRDTSIQKAGKQTGKNDKQKHSSQLELESPLAALIASKKKRKEDKVFVGLHLPRDVDEVLTQFKKDTDIDRSEAVASFVRIMLKDYF